jgi:D-alanyl-lipoteichoic acid acyltransferase DltB (MBOAT superfamily)
MIFNSFQFLFMFLPVALTGTFLLARLSAGAAQCWLIGASLFFYGAWKVAYLPLLLGSILFNYLIALRMVHSENPKLRTCLLCIAVTVDLGLLGYYKYAGFFLENLNAVTGTHYAWKSLILPLGISFYTFQQITLLADNSAGHIKDFRFRDFVLFVTFFPHLIAGPIVHHREMMPQFQQADYRANAENMAVGFVLLAIGLFKKSVLADGIADYITPMFTAAANGEPVSLVYAWAASIGFTLQMYFDFSGYCEMALGLARMVGIKLPMNFNSPLKALSVVDYWSRWHITLTRFLTAYVYTPMAVGLARRRMAARKPGLAGIRTTWRAFFGIIAIPTLVTMFLSGLWHGAGNQFLIFGLLHGVALVINHAWRLVRPRVWPDTAHYHRTSRPFAWALTFLVVIVALTWFHAANVATGANIVIGMAGLHGIVLPNAIAPASAGFASVLSRAGVTFNGQSLYELIAVWLWIAMLLTIALGLPNTLEIMRAWEPAITMPATSAFGRIDAWRGLAARLNMSLSPYWAFAAGALMGIGVLGLNRTSEFLYWQF